MTILSDEEAKVAGKALDLVAKTGPFLERVFGPLVEDTVGVVADKVKFYRLSKYVALTDRTQQLLSSRPHLRAAPPKFALDLIEAATIEESDELSELWARLLANAMTADPPIAMRIAFVSILREMTPLDARLLQAGCQMLVEHGQKIIDRGLGSFDLRRVEFRRLVGDGDLSLADPTKTLYPIPDEENLAWHNLSRLGCAAFNQPGKIWFGITITALGVALVRATMI